MLVSKTRSVDAAIRTLDESERRKVFYFLEGEFNIEVGDQRFHLTAGECAFLPRKVSHVWGCVDKKAGRVINVYQPAGPMEAFFCELSRAKNLPSRDDVV